jgi:hypothetical protein
LRVPPYADGVSSSDRRLGGPSIREFLRTGERGHVTAVHLDWRDAEALADDAAHELGREEAIVATQEEPRRHIGPGLERIRRTDR